MTIILIYEDKTFTHNNRNVFTDFIINISNSVINNGHNTITIYNEYLYYVLTMLIFKFDEVDECNVFNYDKMLLKMLIKDDGEDPITNMTMDRIRLFIQNYIINLNTDKIKFIYTIEDKENFILIMESHINNYTTVNSKYLNIIFKSIIKNYDINNYELLKYILSSFYVESYITVIINLIEYVNVDENVKSNIFPYILLFKSNVNELFKILNNLSIDNIILYKFIFSVCNTFLTKYFDTYSHYIKLNINNPFKDFVYTNSVFNLTDIIIPNKNYLTIIDKGVLLSIDTPPDNKKLDIMCLNIFDRIKLETINENNYINDDRKDINNNDIANAIFKNITKNIFNSKHFKYRYDNTDVYITGSLIGQQCIFNYEASKFKKSDIDIVVTDKSYLYDVLINILVNINRLHKNNIKKYIAKNNNFNIDHFKNIKYTLTPSILYNKQLYKNKTELSYCNKFVYTIDNNKPLIINVFKNVYNRYYYKRVIDIIAVKYKIGVNVGNIIYGMLSSDIEEDYRFKLSNIYYFDNGEYVKYRDMDIYSVKLEKILTHHEPIVRALYNNGNFILSTECLLSGITKTSCNIKYNVDIVNNIMLLNNRTNTNKLYEIVHKKTQQGIYKRMISADNMELLINYIRYIIFNERFIKYKNCYKSSYIKNKLHKLVIETMSNNHYNKILKIIGNNFIIKIFIIV